MRRLNPPSADMLQQIGEAIARIRYGYVQVTIHNARIVQIDQVERTRISQNADLTAGGMEPIPSPTDQTAAGARPSVRGGVNG